MIDYISCLKTDIQEKVTESMLDSLAKPLRFFWISLSFHWASQTQPQTLFTFFLIRTRPFYSISISTCRDLLYIQHYSDVIMSTMVSQITGVSIAYSTVGSGTIQSKHQSSASLAFVRGLHRWRVNSPHKGPVTRKMSQFDDVIMDTLGRQGKVTLTYMCKYIPIGFCHWSLDKDMWILLLLT